MVQIESLWPHALFALPAPGHYLWTQWQLWMIHIWKYVTYQTLPEKGQTEATGNIHEKFREVWTFFGTGRHTSDTLVIILHSKYMPFNSVASCCQNSTLKAVLLILLLKLYYNKLYNKMHYKFTTKCMIVCNNHNSLKWNTKTYFNVFSISKSTFSETTAYTKSLTKRGDVVLLDAERTATERDLVDDDGKAVDVSGLCSRHVRVSQPLLFSQQLRRRPQQCYQVALIYHSYCLHRI